MRKSWANILFSEAPKNFVQQYWSREVTIAPLVTFRILFGGLMATAAFRFWWQGWIDQLFVEPQFYFKLSGFEWVEPLGSLGMHVVFAALILSALAIAAGLYYRWAVLVFGLLFTYVELIDLTNYLNHYYLIVLLCFWLLLIPANGAFSLDVWRKGTPARSQVPVWTINLLVLQLSLVYCFAGYAKLNTDWLFRAMPLAIWLPEHADLPLLGSILAKPMTAFVFSWAGALYDLTIPFFLLFRPTRPFAYLAVVGFHVMTGILFNIGWFPWIMILFTTLFFSPEWHDRLIRSLGWKPSKVEPVAWRMASGLKPLAIGLMITQMILPWRYLAYPGNVFWHEQGYRFSWRVMLVEKHGQAIFQIEDPRTGRTSIVENRRFLTDFQEKQMAIQPDFIVQFARMLDAHYQEYYQIEDPIVRVDSYVALNGRPSQRFIDPSVDLSTVELDWKHKTWVLPFKETP